MSAIPAEVSHIGTRWKSSLLSLLGLILAILILYRETAVAMVRIWYSSETFTHAFLVPVISLWLIWRRRELLRRVEPQPEPWMLLPLAAAAGLWLVSDLVVMNAATQFALVSLVVFAVPAVLGWPTARAMAFPLMFLFFCVPFGEIFLPVMMEHTADFTVFALRATGIPVYREGLQFVIPSGNWSVVEACSGLRYLIASLMVGSLFAYLNYQTPWRRWVFVGVAIVVPIVANWLRAYMIVMIGHLSGNRLAVGVDHLIYGWVFFGIVIGLMFAIGARWAEPEVSLRGPADVAPKGVELRRNAWIGTATVVAICAVAVLPHLASHVLDSQRVGTSPQLDLQPRLAAGWQRLATPVQLWKPRYIEPSGTASALFEKDGQRVGVHLLYYRDQNYERKLVSSQNVLVHSEDNVWKLLGTQSREVPLADGRPAGWRSSELAPAISAASVDTRRMMVWSSYWIDDRLTASDVMAKIYGAIGRLLGHGDDAAAAIVFAEGDDARKADQAVRDFIAAHQDELLRALQVAREKR